MDNLKNSACEIRAEPMFIFLMAGLQKTGRTKRLVLFLHPPFKSSSQRVETAYVLLLQPQAFHVALHAGLLPRIKS